MDIAARVELRTISDRSFDLFAEYHRGDRSTDSGCAAGCKRAGKAEDQRMIFRADGYVCLRIVR